MRLNLFRKPPLQPLPTMTLLEADKKAENSPSFLMRTAHNERFSIPDYGLAENQLQAYQLLGWITEAVSIVARYAAGIELEVFQLVGEDKNSVLNHPFEMLLRKPNPLQSRFRLLEATNANLMLAGNAYWFLLKAAENAKPQEIYNLPANRIKVVPGSTPGLVSHYEWDAGDGIPIRLEAWEICHFAEYHPTDFFVGMSRVESVGKEIQKDAQAATYDLNYFGRDNAKPEALLHFEGNVDDEEWEELKGRFVRRHGGTRRSMALVQGDAKVNYMQLASSHADMEFLAGRAFTRDQIYNHFAPGLAPVLAINSTEANSRTGKATLMEFAIWPLLTSLHETITNRILNLYGDNLVAQFEDVRLSDTAMEMLELVEYAKTHTIDEVRQKYYQDDEIGDERGEMLVAQVGQSTTRTALNAEITQVGAQGQPSGTVETAPAAPELETAGQAKAIVEAPVVLSPQQLIYDELAQWKRFVTKRVKAGASLESLREFGAVHIPPGLRGAIEGALVKAKDKVDVDAIFTDALRWEARP